MSTFSVTNRYYCTRLFRAKLISALFPPLNNHLRKGAWPRKTNLRGFTLSTINCPSALLNLKEFTRRGGQSAFRIPQSAIFFRSSFLLFFLSAIFRASHRKKFWLTLPFNDSGAAFAARELYLEHLQSAARAVQAE